MLFEDNFIDIQNGSYESQVKILQKLEKFNIDKIKSIISSDKIKETVKVTFLQSSYEKANIESQHKMLLDGLIILSEEKQVEFLQKYLLNLGVISNFTYERIKCIALSDKIEEKVKNDFLKSAFAKANPEIQHKMLFDDNLIDIQKETSERQIDLLQKLVSLDVDKIKLILKSDKIKESIKDPFLKVAFEKADAEKQYRMLFDDNLMHIQNETSERQIDLLQKLASLDISEIKLILNSEKIDDTVKDAFLKSAFAKANLEIQYKMLFEDFLVKGISFKLFFLLNSTRCGRMTFKKGFYAGKTYFNVLETDIEYLYKNKINNNSDIDEYYMVKHGSWSKQGGEQNRYYLSSKYEKWKELWISIMEDINRKIENQEIFTDDSTETIFEIISQIYDSSELYKIFGIGFNENAFINTINKALTQLDFNFLSNIKNYKLLASFNKYGSEIYYNIFEQNYCNIPKIDRVRLWIQNLNPYYNYLEFAQVAWKLSNNERKLLNKRIKEYSKNEHLQKFYDQIPAAELIEETESTKTYKCKWRNLFYKDGSVQVFFDKYSSSEDYLWKPAREEWNLLTQEYFNNRRIDDLITTVNGNNQIIQIMGLENIEVQIVIAEVRKNGSTESKTKISSSQITKIIHNVSERNKCINFLASQNSEVKVLDIQELVTNVYGQPSRDVSFLFQIRDWNGNYYLIWESAEFDKSKATHIFKCHEEELEDMMIKIKEFIENNPRVRSRLNSVDSNDLDVKRDLKYLGRVNHDSAEYKVWENRMRELLTFLP
ncbi:MAG: hypothetical protein AB9882_13325 [Ignavibacteriaceae bacterium]